MFYNEYLKELVDMGAFEFFEHWKMRRSVLEAAIRDGGITLNQLIRVTGLAGYDLCLSLEVIE